MPKFLLPYFVAVLLAVIGCASTQQTVQKEASALGGLPLTVVYQQGREGQIEPCGCHSAPYGGIDRELNAITALRKTTPNFLFVDAGNMYGSTDKKSPADILRGRGEMLTGALNEMGLNAYAPGPADYALGIDFLRKMQGLAKFKFVSTNVMDAKGKPVFSPYEIIEVEGVPVAVFSVMGEKSKLGAGLKVAPAKAALEKAIKEVGTKAKVILVLSALGNHSLDRQFAAEVPGINVLIGNDPDLTLVKGDPKGTTLLLEGHRFGYYLGKLSLGLQLPVKGFSSEIIIRDNNATLAGYQSALSKVIDPARKASIEKRIADLKNNELLEAVPGATAFENTLIALEEKTYGTPNSFTELIKKEKEKIRNKAIGAPASPSAK